MAIKTYADIYVNGIRVQKNAEISYQVGGVEDDMEIESLRVQLAYRLAIDPGRIGYERTGEAEWVWTILDCDTETALLAAAYLGTYGHGQHGVMSSNRLATVSDCNKCGLPMQCYDKPDGVHWVCRNHQCRHEERAVVPKVAVKPKVVEIPYTHVPVDSHMKKRKASAKDSSNKWWNRAIASWDAMRRKSASDDRQDCVSMTFGGVVAPRIKQPPADPWSTYPDGPVDGMQVVATRSFGFVCCGDVATLVLGVDEWRTSAPNGVVASYPFNRTTKIKSDWRPLKPARVEVGQRWRYVHHSTVDGGEITNGVYTVIRREGSGWNVMRDVRDGAPKNAWTYSAGFNGHEWQWVPEGE
jgi:hypothetical protein